MKYYEDVRVGDADDLGKYTFAAEDMKSFARRFDPQLFHVDEEAATRSHFGALIASGWQTGAIWMRLMVDHRRGQIEAAKARGEPVAQMGPALGFRDMKWLKPVYAGDTIAYRIEVVDKRISTGRPGMGLLMLLGTGANQHGELVISFVSTTFVERRPEKP